MRRATISLFDRKMPRDLALAFGRFEFRSRTRKLLKDGVPCRIGFKAYLVLHVLLAHRDRVVTLDELLDKVWPNQSVETNNLQVQIWTIRNLIGKEKIVNVARVGYQFVAPTRELFERVAGDGRSLHDPLGSLCIPVCIDEPWEGAHSDRPRLRWRSRSSSSSSSSSSTART